MKVLCAEFTNIVRAPVEQVHRALIDYKVAHPAILPKPYFDTVYVKKGGQGAGTELELKMKVFGQTRTFQHVVSEPEPGRVIAETDTATGLATTFTLEPVQDGLFTEVTIRTEFAASPGIAGWFERFTSPPFLRRLYRQELRNLESYLSHQS